MLKCFLVLAAAGSFKRAAARVDGRNLSHDFAATCVVFAEPRVFLRDTKKRGHVDGGI